MEKFIKIVRLGVGKSGNVYCKITFEAGCLSITGVEGPLANGDARGGCGQIVMSLKAEDIQPAPGWDTAKIQQFLAYWDKWHLNDMQAGTPEQMAELEKHKHKYPGYPMHHYDWAKGVLKEAGLQPHNGYDYGTKWLRVEVPEDVLEFLKSLPETDKTPAWV